MAKFTFGWAMCTAFPLVVFETQRNRNAILLLLLRLLHPLPERLVKNKLCEIEIAGIVIQLFIMLFLKILLLKDNLKIQPGRSTDF